MIEIILYQILLKTAEQKNLILQEYHRTLSSCKLYQGLSLINTLEPVTKFTADLSKMLLLMICALSVSL